MKQKWVDAYMDVAERFAQLSSAEKLKVGAVVVKDHRIISIGYNGTPAGWDNVCEDREWCNAGGWLSAEEIEEGWPFEGTYKDIDGHEMKGRYRLTTKPEVIHAERNALDKLARDEGGGKGAALFCTHMPCMECAKSIYTSGISSVYYRAAYKSDSGIEFLEKCGVKVSKV